MDDPNRAHPSLSLALRLKLNRDVVAAASSHLSQKFVYRNWKNYFSSETFFFSAIEWHFTFFDDGRRKYDPEENFVGDLKDEI